MNDREEFDKYLAASGISYRHDVALSAWQACAELKDRQIKELEHKIELYKATAKRLGWTLDSDIEV